MEAAGYEPKERTHSNIPTFCWLWVTSGNNRTAAEAQQNTNECWWKAGSVPEMLGCWCGVGGMNMCPWPALNRGNTKLRDSLPTPPRIYFAKGQMNLAICHHQVKLSKARERAKGQSSMKCCALICYCIWGWFDFQGKREPVAAP